MEEKKNIEVVSGDGSNLEISPVYDHLNVSTPKSAEKKPKYVVIPEEKKKKEKHEDKKEEENPPLDEPERDNIPPAASIGTFPNRATVASIWS